MSDINVGGPRGGIQPSYDQPQVTNRRGPDGPLGIQPSNVEPNQVSTGKVGEYGGHSVGQAQVAQQPARQSGIGDKIANFFTSTLPKFFSSVGESISNFFSKLTAPTPQQPQTTGTTGAQQTGGIQPQQDKGASLKTVYDTIRGATQNFDKGTFLRTDNASSPIIKNTLEGVGSQYAENAVVGLPKNGVVAVRVAPFENRSTGFTPSQLSDRQQVIESSMSCLEETWGRFFGTDEMTTGRAASSLPQSVKDLLATAFKAIDDSPISADDKQVAKQRVISDVVLRGITPHLNREGVGATNKHESMRELNGLMMSIASGLSPDRLNQRGAYTDEAVTHLSEQVEGTGKSRVEIMQHNMYQMFLKAGEEGTPYVPTKAPEQQPQVSDMVLIRP